MNPSEGVREIEKIARTITRCHWNEYIIQDGINERDLIEDIAEALTQAEKRGFERAREEAVNLVKNEPELEGNCPKEIKAQLSKLSFEEQARTHVRATKKNIENNIRNLTYEKKGTKNAKTN